MTFRLTLIFIFVFHAAFSQERSIVGRILDAGTQTPVKDANIIIPGTAKATFSNHLGYFELPVDRTQHKTFQISHIGYKIIQLPIPAEDKFRLNLERDSVLLQAINLNQYPILEPDVDSLLPSDQESPAESEAMFPGGIETFYSYMGNALASALPNVSEPGFRVIFTIDETGQATDVKISNPAQEIQTAVNQAFQQMPRWTPATQRQKNVKQLFVLPVRRFTPRVIQASDLKDFYSFIQKTIKYPAQAKRMGIEGLVVMEFEIDQAGNIMAVTLLRGLDESCNTEVKRVILVTPAEHFKALFEKTQETKFMLPVFLGLDGPIKKGRDYKPTSTAFMMPPIDVVAGALTVQRREIGGSVTSSKPWNGVTGPTEVTYLSLTDALKEQNTARRLMLKNNNLKSFPVEILNLRKLIFLDLERNEIQSLPDGIDVLDDLKELYLPNNKLTGLPDNVVNLKKLKTLGLGNNQFASFPASIPALVKLEELDLSNNQLSEIPAEIGLLKNLRVLMLSNNTIKSLPQELFQLKKLDKIYLRGNSIKPEDLTLLKKTFKNAEFDF
jgi:Leucine rich repeat/CarboxypepD_reg-like domain/Gram-negative bacterial TonB protein C-terminal